MATTRIIPMHRKPSKSISSCLHDRIDYAENPEKTDDGELIKSYMCDPMTADAEFALSKREYLQITGRRQERDVIAYQIRQSFKPGEITPEEANAIGYEFAKRFTKENHAFIVCTHIDKAHIHNHHGSGYYTRKDVCTAYGCHRDECYEESNNPKTYVK